MGFGRMWQIVTIVFSTFASLILWRLHSQVKNPDSLGWTRDGSPGCGFLGKGVTPSYYKANHGHGNVHFTQFSLLTGLVGALGITQFGVLKGLHCNDLCSDCTPGCHWLDWEWHILCCSLSENAWNSVMILTWSAHTVLVPPWFQKVSPIFRETVGGAGLVNYVWNCCMLQANSPKNLGKREADPRLGAMKGFPQSCSKNGW